MRIGVDFDRVLFDTDSFDSALKEKTGLYHVEEDVYDDNGCYSPEKHARVCGIEPEEVYDWVTQAGEFVYNDYRALEDLKENHELVLVTRGHERFQRAKIEASGVERVFDRIEVVKTESKDSVGIDLLIDDSEEEHDMTNVMGMLFDRDSHQVEDAVGFVRERELENGTMRAEDIFKRYDVRGKYPEELNEEFARRIGRSLAKLVLEDDRFEAEVVVGRDNKKSSEPLKEEMVEGVRSAGVDVVDAGVGPTDLVAFHGSRRRLVSVQVTSSHMPLDFNGFKFMYPEGNGFVNRDLNRVEEYFRLDEFPEGSGEKSELESPREEYIDAVEEFVQGFKDVDGRKVVVDTLGGATRELLPEILERLGVDVVDVADEKEEEGPYYDPPNPKPEVLEDMPERVNEEDADIGLATDMDGDRVAAYYDGEWVSGDDLFFIFAQVFEGDLVASIDSSSALERFAEGVHFTRVGDPFVIDRTLEEDVSLSGEPNGHYCFTDFVAYNSGTAAAALLAVLNLRDLAESLPDLHIAKSNIDTEKKGEVMEKVQEEVRGSYDLISDRDGVKFSAGDSSVLVRPSGSSPVVRVKVESSSSRDADRTLEEVKSMVREQI
ncbi:MAG: hypothetical protein ABEJ03_01100 [Candidatus Nanohaloarchaea archaeon]